MDPVALVALPALMELSSGRADVVVGLVDGPVHLDHPSFASEHLRASSPDVAAACRASGTMACRHGTFIAGVLAARRGSGAPALVPDCTLLARPIFGEAASEAELPSASPEELARAIVDCVDAGAWILNLSVAMVGGSIGAERVLEQALRHAARRQVLVVAAAGNQGVLGSSAITRHPWVLPVVAYTREGRPLPESNLGRSMGRGLGAAGEGVVSTTPGGGLAAATGTSIAAPFVTGAAALLWSLVPDASADDVRRALLSSTGQRRRTVVPPLLDAWAAYGWLSIDRDRRVL